MPSILAASFFKADNSTQLVKWRLHTHFEVDRGLPTRIDVTPDAGGDCDERAVLERTIEGDRLYKMDRGYAKFSLFKALVNASSSYVCRLRDNSVYDVPTEIISMIYAQRWQIESFFRFFKQFLSCSHLLSHRQNGIEIQAYCAIIACLLINLWTGGKATKRTFEMIYH